MTLREMVSSTSAGVANAVHGVRRFARLERVLAVVCLFIPAFLIWFDNGPFDDGRIRDSISAYYDMEANQVFYFPLTVASMLFGLMRLLLSQRLISRLCSAWFFSTVDTRI